MRLWLSAKSARMRKKKERLYEREFSTTRSILDCEEMSTRETREWRLEQGSKRGTIKDLRDPETKTASVAHGQTNEDAKKEEEMIWAKTCNSSTATFEKCQHAKHTRRDARV